MPCRGCKQFAVVQRFTQHFRDKILSSSTVILKYVIHFKFWKLCTHAAGRDQSRCKGALLGREAKKSKESVWDLSGRERKREGREPQLNNFAQLSNNRWRGWGDHSARGTQNLRNVPKIMRNWLKTKTPKICQNDAEQDLCYLCNVACESNTFAFLRDIILLIITITRSGRENNGRKHGHLDAFTHAI